MDEGLLVLVGVGHSDTVTQASELARRLVHLRVFPDADGRMNRSLLEAGGALGVVSQFTLMADTRQGRRPSYKDAAAGEHAQPLIARLMEAAAEFGVPVVGGRFGAEMQVELVNDGPVTLWLDTERRPSND